MIRSLLKLCLICTTVTASAASRSGDGIAATINGEAVTYFEILSYNRFAEVQLMRRYTGKDLKDKIIESRREAVQNYIDQQILINEFKEKEFQIPRFIIEERIDSVIRQQAGGDREAFKKQLKKQNIAWNDYRQQLKDRVAVNMMLSQFVYNNIKIDDSEIDTYIASHIDKLKKPGKRNLAIILLLKQGKFKDKLDKTTAEISQKLKKGDSFAELVKHYSEGPFAGKNGDMGWIEDQNIRPECRAAVLALEKDEVSEAMTLEEGHVAFFKLIDKKLPIQDPQNPAIRSQARSILRTRKENQTYDQYLEKLRDKNIIQNFTAE